MVDDEKRAIAPRRLAKLRAEAVWAAIVLVAICVALSLAGVLAWRAQTIKLQHETRARQIEEDRRQADLCYVVRLVNPSDAPAPTSERGRKVADGLNAYVRRNC